MRQFSHFHTQGKLHVSRRNPREGVVQVGGGGDSAGLGRLVRIVGRAAMNRAMDGDMVAVQVAVRAAEVRTASAANLAAGWAGQAVPSQQAAVAEAMGDEDE